MKYLLAFDTETYNAKRDGNIMTISGYIYHGSEIKCGFDIQSAPVKGLVVDPNALEINGGVIEECEKYSDAKSSVKLFSSILKKNLGGERAHVLAYNSGFDVDTTCAWFDVANVFRQYFGKYVNFIQLDPLRYYDIELYNSKSSVIPSRKLGDLADLLKIKKDESKLHESIYDIQIAIRIANELGITKLSTDFDSVQLITNKR